MRQLSMLLVIRANADETPEASTADRQAAREWAQKASQITGPQGNQELCKSVREWRKRT